MYVATENDTVYALDSVTGAVVWKRHVGTPVPVVGPDPPTTGCGDINPLGITGTPVIDPATQRIFAVAETWDGSDPSSIQHVLLGFDLADGATVSGLPRVVDVAGSTPRYQLQRPGLALDGGKVIIGFGGNSGDCGDYHGRIVAAAEDGSSVDSFSAQSPESAVWGSGNGLPVDGQGNIWATTGNGGSGTFGYQESVLRLRLTPGVTLADWWAPSDWSALDASDLDLGSSEPLLLPDGLVFAIGKAGVGYLLSASHLGGTGSDPVFKADVCAGSWGGSIYVSGVIYVTCSDGIWALSLNAQAKTFSPLAGWSVTSGAVGPPIEAGGLIWSAGWQDGTLYGLDPATGSVTFSTNLGSFNHFATPSAGGGLLFVANDDQVTALRIANTPPPSPTATTMSASTRTAAAGAPVTLTATVSPAPNAGTVRFTDGAATIAGCATAAVNPVSGRATCTTTWHQAGTHTLGALYTGDAFYAGSRSAAITVQVRVVPPPVLSRPHLSGERDDADAAAHPVDLGHGHGHDHATGRRPAGKRPVSHRGPTRTTMHADGASRPVHAARPPRCQHVPAEALPSARRPVRRLRVGGRQPPPRLPDESPHADGGGAPPPLTTGRAGSRPWAREPLPSGAVSVCVRLCRDSREE